MSFQAYLDKVQAQTGKTADDFKALAAAKGLSAHAELLAWLKGEFGLGHGHANAVIAAIRQAAQPQRTPDDKVAAHFSGAKAKWRETFDNLLADLRKGPAPDAEIAPASSYLSLVRAGRKFAIVQAGAGHLDLGIKLKGVSADGRLEDAGTWNAMVTHRVRLTDPTQIDAQVMGWLSEAYGKA